MQLLLLLSQSVVVQAVEVLLLLLLLLLLVIVNAVVVPLVSTRVIHDGRLLFQSVGFARFVPVIGIGCSVGIGRRRRCGSRSSSSATPGPLLWPLRVLLHVLGQVRFLSV